MMTRLAGVTIPGRTWVPHAGVVMPNSKLRCTNCRQYRDRDTFYRVSSLEKVCSEECFLELRGSRNAPSERSLKSGGSLGGPTRRTRKDDPPPKTRAKVMLRDKGKCRFCGSQAASQHHINYRSEGVDHSEHNLIVLCQQHHDLVHSSKRKWKPLLLMVIWYQYVYGRYITVPQAESLDRQGDKSYDEGS